ncbi:hypothetical protein C5O84_17630 [Escherichia coli]|nr:hypothetical protein C5O84_17630 [Escherichia coli]
MSEGRWHNGLRWAGILLGLYGSLCDLNYWIGPVDKNQRISRTGNSTLLWIFKDIRIMTKSRV